MLIETASGPFKAALTTNSTSSSFPSKIPTITEPTGSGVLEMAGLGLSPAKNLIVVVPYAVAGDNDTFSVRFIGWRSVGTDTTKLWVPVILAEIACTACAVVGVANAAVIATERFVDTITLVTGNNNVSIDITSPTGDVVGHAMLDAKGFQKVEITFDSTAAGATSMNCLVALL